MIPDKLQRLEYERPHELWQCGHACRDESCVMGPTRSGVCQAGAGCQPIQRNDTWCCTRSLTRGGPCASGPALDGTCGRHASSCLPRASLRLRRKWFVFACGTLMAGLVMVGWGSSWRNEFLAPGGLIGPHAQILSGSRYRERCAACHAAGDVDSESWLKIALLGPPSSTAPQSQKCLHCHDQRIDPSVALLAHSMPANELAKNTNAIPPEQRTDLLSVPDRSAHDELQCAQCHREHHGRRFDLAAVDNVQCQTCHAAQFKSFAHGHPEFKQLARSLSDGLPFDHRRHLHKHFAETKQQFQCVMCHQTGARGAIVRTGRYAESCAGCHDTNIRVALGSGLEIVSLPVLDTEAFGTQGIQFEGWPEDLTGDFDGRISLSTRLLLAADPQVRHALDVLGKDGDFANVEATDTVQVRQAAIVASGLVQLLRGLSANARTTLIERSSNEVFSSLVRVVPQTWWQDTLSQWFSVDFPHVSGLDPTTKSASGDPSHATPVSTMELLSQTNTGEWVRDNDKQTMTYLPNGHADPWIRAWLDTVASQYGNDPDMLTAVNRSAEGIACLQCHPIHGNSIVWGESVGAPKMTLGFTKFRHEPHLVQPHLRDCTACHRLMPPAEAVTNSEALETVTEQGMSRSVRSEISEFHPLQKETCVGCHTPNGAGDGCVQCHRYHVGNVAAP